MLSNNLSQFMSKSVTSLIGVLFTSSHIKNPGKGKELKAPDAFSPVLRFAVCSDVHLNGEKDQEAAVRFGQLFDDMYSAFDKLDALVIAGDFTGGGAEKEYEMFNLIVSEHIRPETKLLPILGNHEFINYRDYDATIGYDVYKKYISEQVDTHFVVNGFHFIGVSYDNDGKKFAGKLAWLKEQLDEAVKEDPSKPVFVYQHPHPFATVYGSINWGTYEVRKVLQKYPQVVNFSGHSHYAPSDPRSVWQGSFTAVGCGSLAAFMGNLNYIEGDKDAPGKSGGFRLVEVDKDGCIRMRLYDSENRTFFENCEYYFTNINKTTKRNYTWHRQKSLDTKPLFPNNAQIFAEKASDGSVLLKFPNAKGHYDAENYKITVSASGKKVFEKTVISDYVRAVSDGMSVNVGSIEKGEYAVKIVPYSPYAKKGSTIKGTIEIS
ncbi:MAG: metallophosphoesterase [Clostridia bacterium]|nr:metallophosphoesterase [Clostridia bacterium]